MANFWREGMSILPHRATLWRWLLPALAGLLLLSILAPVATSAATDLVLGETAVVSDGRVRLVRGGTVHELDAGDAVTFDADLPHHFENPGPGEASFYAVVSAGLRRS